MLWKVAAGVRTARIVSESLPRLRLCVLAAAIGAHSSALWYFPVGAGRCKQPRLLTVFVPSPQPVCSEIRSSFSGLNL